MVGLAAGCANPCRNRDSRDGTVCNIAKRPRSRRRTGTVVGGIDTVSAARSSHPVERPAPVRPGRPRCTFCRRGLRGPRGACPYRLTARRPRHTTSPTQKRGRRWKHRIPCPPSRRWSGPYEVEAAFKAGAVHGHRFDSAHVALAVHVPQVRQVHGVLRRFLGGRETGGSVIPIRSIRLPTAVLPAGSIAAAVRRCPTRRTPCPEFRVSRTP